MFSYWLQTLGINLDLLHISHDQDEDKVITIELYDRDKAHHSAISGLEEFGFSKKEINKLVAVLSKNYCKRAKSYKNNKSEPIIVKTFEIKDNFFSGLFSEAE